MPSLNPMSDDRQQHLVKCAEDVIGLMNVGVKPDAALLKVAKDEALNTNEVTLVSRAINNSKTLSHLASAKADEKGAPFTLTNAELVNQQLNDKDPVVPGKEKSLESERKSDLDKKKEAAASSLFDDGFYLDPVQDDHAAKFREACGKADQLQQRKVASVVIDEDLSVSFENGEDATAKLAHLKSQADQARTNYAKAHETAIVAVEKFASAFLVPAAPNFARIEKLAQYHGCAQEILDTAYALAGLDRWKVKRASGEKLAGLIEASPVETELVDVALRAETLLKEAASWLALKEHLTEAHDEILAGLKKQAEADLSSSVERASKDISELPDAVMGHGVDRKGISDLLGSAAGSSPAETAPSFNEPDKTPLPINSRQELANTDGRLSIEHLLGDPYIGAHPLQNVVAAFNRAQSVNPGLGQSELASLVRQDLASEGGVPLDTLLRTRDSKGPE
jgi:hypothetical protein